jgi:putative two-component system response regulator
MGADSASSASASATPHSRLRALVIDDDPDLLMLVRRTLEFTAGWVVATAGSGAAGIELARGAELPPQVILVDVMMPEMDGYEVCRRLKSDPRLEAIPIVLLTARRDLNAGQLAASGAAGVVLKPFQPAELAQQVLEFCR